MTVKIACPSVNAQTPKPELMDSAAVTLTIRILGPKPRKSATKAHLAKLCGAVLRNAWLSPRRYKIKFSVPPIF